MSASLSLSSSVSIFLSLPFVLSLRFNFSLYLFLCLFFSSHHPTTPPPPFFPPPPDFELIQHLASSCSLNSLNCATPGTALTYRHIRSASTQTLDVSGPTGASSQDQNHRHHENHKHHENHRHHPPPQIWEEDDVHLWWRLAGVGMGRGGRWGGHLWPCEMYTGNLCSWTRF